MTKWFIQIVQTQIRLKEQLIKVYTVCHSSDYFKEQLHKKQILVEKKTNME